MKKEKGIVSTGFYGAGAPVKLIAKCLLCVLVLTLALPAMAYAADTQTYVIQEMGLTLKIPTGLIVLTRDTKPDDPQLKRSRFTADEWAREYREKNYYMRVMDPDWSYDITLTMETSPNSRPYEDLAGMSAARLQQEMDSMRAHYESLGYRDLSVQRHDTTQMPYIEVRYNESEGDLRYWTIQYQTVHRGQAIYLEIYCYNGAPTREQQAILQGIVDTAVYAPAAAASPAVTPRPTATAAAAGTKTHTIREANLALKLPADLIVLTRGMAPDDPELRRSGFTADEWAQQCRESEKLYLRALDAQDFDFDIAVDVYTDENSKSFQNYNLSTEGELKDIEGLYRKAFSDVQGFSVDRYHTAQAIYFILRYQEVHNGSPYHTVQYQTISEGYSINLCLYSYGKPVTPEQEALLRAIVDSAVFAPPAAASPAATPLTPSPAPQPADGSGTHTLPELGLTLRVPPELIVLTRGMSPDNPELKRGGFSADEWAAHCSKNESLYMQAMSPDGNFNIHVIMNTITGGESDYASMSADELQAIEDSYREYYAMDSSYSDLSIARYAAPQATFLVLRYKGGQGDAVYHTLQYETVYNGKTYTLGLFNYDGPITQEREALLHGIVDSAVFAPAAAGSPAPSVLPTPPPPSRPAALSSVGGTHTIPELGLTLTMPDDLVVFGPNIDPKDPNLLLLDLDVEDLESYHREQNVYLDAIETDWAYAIEAALCTAEGAQAFDGASSLSPEVLQAAEDFLRSAYTRKGAEKLDLGRYTTPQAVYIRARYELPDADLPVCAVEYLTLHGGRVIRLTLNNYNGPVSLEQQATLKTIVDTAVFDSSAAASPSPAVQPTATQAQSANVDSAPSLWKRWEPLVGRVMDLSMMMLAFMVGAILTILLYTVPILIYRYAVRKTPMPKPSARKITIFSSAVALIAVTAVCLSLQMVAPAIALLLCGYANYRILTGGKAKQGQSAAVDSAGSHVNEPAPGQDEHPQPPATPDSNARYCTKCGTKISSDGFFCAACGVRIDKGVYM